MILWTIQTMEAWRVLQNTGILHCPASYAQKDLEDAYAWLIQQMLKKVPVQPQPNTTPLWAWYQYDGEKRKRPDLRSVGHLLKGTQGVRIEFQIEDSLVLLSDYELWHYVLNTWYLPLSENEELLFEEKVQKKGINYHNKDQLMGDPELKYLVQGSWHHIFDLEWHPLEQYIPKSIKSIQATFWELPFSAIRKVDTFIAR